MEEEEDYIVKKIPVYLSKQLSDQLYLYQYPLRPASMKYNKTTFCLSAIKPEHQEIKLEASLNVNSVNFDVSKAEEIALNADGEPGLQTKDGDTAFENGMMDKQCFVSSKAVENCDKYAIGVVHGSEIHLTPLKGIVQLRPSLSYLDKCDRRNKESERSVSESEDVVDESQQQITVKFAQTESERVRKAREKSFNYLSKRSAEEPWCHTKWHHPQSDAADLERMKLIAEERDAIGVSDMSAKEYLKLLVPVDKEEAAIVPQLPAHMISLNSLKTLPLPEQCKLLLKDGECDGTSGANACMTCASVSAKIISFQQLMVLLAGSEGLSSKTVLRTLPQVALTIRGNWVVKSEVLYPKDTFSSTSGVPSHIMCKSRDFVLYLFTQRQFVDRKKVSAVIKLPADETKEIFVGISRLRLNKGWELLLPTDTVFLDKFPDVVQRQSLVWEHKAKQLADFIGDTAAANKKRRKSKSVNEDAGSS